MALSDYRYTTVPQQQQQQNSQTSSSGQKSDTSVATTTSSSTSNTNYNERIQNMTPQSLAALESLIAQLMGGGTPEQRAQQAQRDREIASTRGQQASYSKEAAFADAQGAMSKAMRETLEKLMPSIVRAAEGAGTSANSMRALLTQQAATQAAEASSALGLQAASNYGGIAASFASVLEGLTRPDDQVTQALIAALNAAKGAVQTKTGSSTTNQSGTQTTVTQNNSNVDEDRTVTYTPFTPTPITAGATSLTSPSGSSSYPANFSSQSAYDNYLVQSSTQRALQEMVAAQSGWNSYGSF